MTKEDSIKDKLMFFILATYFFIVAFGNLFKLSSSEVSLGLSTLLILLMVALKINVIPRGLQSNSVFKLVFLLLFWCLIAALFSDPAMRYMAYVTDISMFGYLFAAIAVYQTRITEERIHLLLYMLAISIFLASVFTIVDYLKIYNIPYVNEIGIATELGDGALEQAGGFFSRRSAMAAYYTLILPTLLYSAFKSQSLKVKLFFPVSAGFGMLALFLTHNRSGILSMIMSMFIFMYLDKSIKVTRKIAFMVYLPIIFGFLIYVAYLYFPQHLDVYIMKLNRFMPGEGIEVNLKATDSMVESDYSRVYFFATVMESLLSNPIGNGFGHIFTEKYGYVSPHNLITQIIWSAGIVSFIWFLFFSYHIKKHFSIKHFTGVNSSKSNVIALVTAFQVGLLSWLINNMVHNSLSTGLAWLYLGVILNLINRLKTENDEPDTGDEEMLVTKQKPQRYLHLKN